MNYQYIDPNNFEVSEAISILNSNIRYLYDNQQSNKNSSEEGETGANLIPYSDFSELSHLRYWKPINSTLYIKDKKLKVLGTNSDLGLISPVLTEPLEENETYSVLLTAQENVPDGYFTECYLKSEDDGKIVKADFYKLISQDSEGTYKVLIKPEETITNCRLYLISGYPNELQTISYSYTDKLDEKFFKDGYVRFRYNYDEPNEDEVCYIRDSIIYAYLTKNETMLELLNSVTVTDGDTKVCPSVYYPSGEDTSRFGLTSIYEDVLLTYVNYKLGKDISKNLDRIAYYYNKSKVKGAFPLTLSSKDYSILTSLQVYELLNVYVTDNGNRTATDIGGTEYNLADLISGISTFIKSKIKDINDVFIRGGFTEENGVLEWTYLTDSNELSTTISSSVQFELIRLMHRLDIDNSSYITKILDINREMIPSLFTLQGVETLDSIVSATQLIQLHNLWLTFDKSYNGHLIGLLEDFKLESSGLYPYNFNSKSSIISTNQYLEELLDSTSYVAPRRIYFSNIAVCKGNVSSSENISTGVIDTIKEELNRVGISVGKDYILAVVKNSFVTKTYLDGELQTVYNKINEVSLKLDIDSIVAKVEKSEAFTNMSDELNSLKELTKANKSTIEILSNKINLTVGDQKFQTNLIVSSTIGSNMIRNSSFSARTRDNWEFTNITNPPITKTSTNKTYIHLESAIEFSMTQTLTKKLQKGNHTLSMEIYGSGTITVDIISEGTTVKTEVITPKTSESRFNVAFNLDKDSSETTIKFHSSNCNLNISYIKLCRGSIDYGWSPSSEDSSLYESSMISSYRAITKDSLTADNANTLANNLEIDSNISIKLLSILTQHSLLGSSSLYSNAMKSITDLTSSTSNLLTYLRAQDFTDLSKLDPLLVAYYSAYMSVYTDIVALSNYISHLDTQLADSNALTKLKTEIQEVDGAITDLDKQLRDAFQDGILTSEEKMKLSAQLKVVEKEKRDVDIRVKYYTEDKNIAESEEVKTLTSTYNNYNTAYTDLVNQVNKILDSDKVTEDMRYAFNNYLDLYIQQSKLLESALLKVATKYYNSMYQTDISELETKVSDLSKSVKSLEGIIGDSSGDGILTTIEKRAIETKMDDVTRSYLSVKSEIDYYQAQSGLTGTTELSDLNSAESQLDTDYTSLDTEVKNFMKLTQITKDDTTRVNGYVDKLSESLKAVQSCLIACLIKLSTVATGSDISGLMTKLNQLSGTVDGMTNFTDKAFLDGILSYTETITILEFLKELQEEQKEILASVDTLKSNTSLSGTTQLTNLNTASSKLTQAYNKLKATIESLIKDSKVTDSERSSYNTDRSNYNTALTNLKKAVSDAETYLTNLKIENKYNESKKYIDGLIGSVNGAIDDITKFNNKSFVDGIISKSEKSTYKVLLDSLYKEHLDITKQINVYSSSTLTPELVGTTELANLIKSSQQYESAYNTYHDTIQTIVDYVGITIADKTNYTRDKSAYESKLSDIREKLLACANKISQVQINKSLHYTDSNGETVSVVEWVKDAKINLTKESIKQYVENTSTVLTTKTYLTNNYLTKEQIESTYATASSLKLTNDSIKGLVKSTDMESYKLSFLDGISTGSNLVVNSNFWAKLNKWSYPSAYISYDSSKQYNGHSSAKIQTPSDYSSTATLSQALTGITLKKGTDYRFGFRYWVDDPKVFTKSFGMSLVGIPVGSTTKETISSIEITPDKAVSKIWKKATMKTALKKEYSSIEVFLYTRNTGTHWVTDIQVEEGTVLGPWSHSALDYELEFTSVKTSMSSIEQKADRIDLIVSSNSTQSNISITDKFIEAIASSNIKLKANQIALEGIVTANESFRILLDGSVELVNLTVNGSISAQDLVIENISNTRYPQTLDADTTVYINSSAQDPDKFDDGNTYPSISSLLDVCPYNLGGHTLTIEFKSDINDNFTIDGLLNGKVVLLFSNHTVKGYMDLKGKTVEYELPDTGTIMPNAGLPYDNYSFAVLTNAQVNIDHITIYAPKSATTTTTTSTTKKTVTALVNVNMRTGPSTSYGYAGALPKGATTDILDTDSTTGWYKITYNSKTGWVTNKTEYVKVDTVTIPGSTTVATGMGIGAYNKGHLMVSGCKFIDCQSAVRTYLDSKAYITNTSGATASHAFVASSGSVISFGATTNCGKTGATKASDNYATYSNGRIYANGTTFKADTVAGNNTAPAPTVTTKTVTVTATYADTYRKTVYNNWKKDGTARQGDYGYGDCVGCWFFGNKLSEYLTNKVKSVVITMYRQQGGVYAAVNCTLKLHNYTTRPSGVPTFNSNFSKNFSVAVNNSVSVTLSASEITALKSAKGFGLSPIAQSSGYYAVFSGNMQVKITYEG